MNNYLIPANSKRGNLIFGLFRPSDLGLFGTGVAVTLIAILIFQGQLSNTLIAIGCLSPALITGLLVAPVPYYHNVLNVLVEGYEFITTRQRLYWKGWCYKDGKLK